MHYGSLFRPHQKKILSIAYIAGIYVLLAIFFCFVSSFVKTPLIITDEVQYRLLAENLYRYGNFILRDNFVTTIPPLYSFLLFVSKKIFIFNRLQYYQVVNAFLFSSALFPLYLIAKQFGISSKGSLVVGILGCIIPHSFYIALCMSENLYYPLFLVFIYFAVLFTGSPNIYRAVFVGITGGLCVLVKMSACIIIISFIFTNIIFFLYYFFGYRKNRHAGIIHNYLILPMISFVISILIFLPWIFIKYSKMGVTKSSTFGAYSSSLNVMFSRLFSISAVKMIAVYFSDIIFASGFVLLVPIFYGFKNLGNDSDRRKYFLIFIFAITLVLTAALFSGLNSTWLRERHMFMIIPLIVVLFFSSINLFPDTNIQSRLAIVACNFAVCTTALIFLGLYNLKLATPVLESPWLEILKFYSLFGIRWGDTFGNLEIFLLPLVTVLSLIFFLKKKYVVKIIYLWLFILFFTTSTATYSMMAKWSHLRLNDKVTEIVKWLEGSMGQQKKLMILGRPAYFEPSSNKSLDTKAVAWSEHLLLTRVFICRLEMAGLFDVKIIPDVNEIKGFSDGSSYYFLSPMKIEGLDEISKYGPLILYDASKLQTESEISLRYETTIDPRWFYSLSGKFFNDDDGFSIKSTGPGYVAYGPYWNLPRGTYEAEFMIKCPVDSKMIIDVFSKDHAQISESIVNCYGDFNKSLQFDVTSNEQYQFRVDLRDGQILFKGINLKER